MTTRSETLIGHDSRDTSAAREQAQSRPESSRLHPDAVSLEISVNVHGSRLTPATSGASARVKPFEEQASTMIVFPQGGVLKMSTPVALGQAVVLTNLRSRQDAICRITRVRACGDGRNYVEVEFTSRQPGYWGVRFPSDGPDQATQTVAQPEPPLAQPAHSAPSAPQSAKAAVTEKAHTATPETDSKRVDILATIAPVSSTSGVQPNVLPASLPPVTANDKVKSPKPSAYAAWSAESISPPKAGPLKEAPSAPSPVPGEPVAEPIKSASPSLTNHPAESPYAAFGDAQPTRVSAEAHSSSQEMFGTRLTVSAASAQRRTASRGGKWIWVGVGAAAILVALAAYSYYFRADQAPEAVASSIVATSSHPADANASTDSAAQPVSSASNTVAPPVAELGTNGTAGAAPASPVPTDSTVTQHSFDSIVSRSRRPSELPRVRRGDALPSTLSTLRSRPVIHAPKSAPAGPAPALAPEAISGIGNDAVAADPIPPAGVSAPPQATEGPIRVGGELKQPTLISSVLPVYPAIARAANVQGSVVVDILIDKAGSVTSAKAISGPPVLRQAAVDAVRRWKYEPSRLDGRVVSVRAYVTIQFRR